MATDPPGFWQRVFPSQLLRTNLTNVTSAHAVETSRSSAESDMPATFLTNVSVTSLNCERLDTRILEPGFDTNAQDRSHTPRTYLTDSQIVSDISESTALTPQTCIPRTYITDTTLQELTPR